MDIVITISAVLKQIIFSVSFWWAFDSENKPDMLVRVFRILQW
jgi:hypothetical protein